MEFLIGLKLKQIFKFYKKSLTQKNKENIIGEIKSYFVPNASKMNVICNYLLGYTI